MSKPPETKNESRYWFPAKTHGWGWGFPSRWEGWVVFSIYLTFCASSVILSGASPAIFVPSTLLATMLFLTIGYWKGEPPRWRWGDSSKI